jgi:hypothetical protein
MAFINIRIELKRHGAIDRSLELISFRTSTSDDESFTDLRVYLHGSLPSSSNTFVYPIHFINMWRRSFNTVVGFLGTLSSNNQDIAIKDIDRRIKYFIGHKSSEAFTSKYSVIGLEKSIDTGLGKMWEIVILTFDCKKLADLVALQYSPSEMFEEKFLIPEEMEECLSYEYINFSSVTTAKNVLQYIEDRIEDLYLKERKSSIDSKVFDNFLNTLCKVYNKDNPSEVFLSRVRDFIIELSKKRDTLDADPSLAYIRSV